MTASKYNSEGYYDPTTYEALSRIERPAIKSQYPKSKIQDKF